MTTTTKRKSNKGGIVFTYIIALLCLIAGLFVPLYGNSEVLTERMLFLHLPEALNLALGQTVLTADWFLPFTETYSFTTFGLYCNYFAWTLVIYAAITVIGIIFLIPVLLCNKEGKGSAVCAYIIEVAASLILSVYILFRMFYTKTPEDWTNFSVLVAFGGTLLMLIIQSFFNKKGLGVCKFFLYLLSAVSVIMLFDISLWVTALAEPFNNMAESGIPAKIVTTGIPFEYFVYYTLSIQDIGTELSVFETNVKILNIALILLTTLVVINFLIDTIALATNSKYDKEGVVKVNAFTKIFGLVRYGLELLAAIFTLIMILVNGAQVGLFLYILLVAVVIQVVIELIRVLKLKSLKKKYVESRKMVFDDDELTKEHTEEMVISAQPIYEESEQPVYAEETPATEEEPEKLEQEDIYEEQGEQTPYEEKDTNIEDAMPYTRQSETVAEPENTTENQQPTYVYNVRTVYNGPTDKFMDTLTDEEKVEFHQVFIEKSKGNLPRIPDYVIGGDNNDFFPQVFIYLGKFRNILTPSLLAKIYKQLNVIK